MSRSEGSKEYSVVCALCEKRFTTIRLQARYCSKRCGKLVRNVSLSKTRPLSKIHRGIAQKLMDNLAADGTGQTFDRARSTRGSKFLSDGSGYD